MEGRQNMQVKPSLENVIQRCGKNRLDF